MNRILTERSQIWKCTFYIYYRIALTSSSKTGRTTSWCSRRKLVTGGWEPHGGFCFLIYMLAHLVQLHWVAHLKSVQLFSVHQPLKKSKAPQPRSIIVCNRLKKKSFSGQPQYPCCLSLPSRRPRGQLSVILSKLLTAFVIHLLSNNLENFSQKTTVPRSKEH